MSTRRFDKTILPPPVMRFSRFGLGMRYLNRDSEAAWLAVLFASPVLVMIGLLFLSTLKAELPYLLEGVDVQGRVVDVHLVSLPRQAAPIAAAPSLAPLWAHGGGGPRCRIRYEFTDATGQRHTGEDSVRAGFAQHLRAGAPVPIRYVRSQPARSQTGFQSKWSVGSLAVPPMVIGGVLSWGVWASVRAVRRASQRARIISTGLAVRAWVTNWRQYKHQYKFRSREERTEICYYFVCEGLGRVEGKVVTSAKLPPYWREGAEIVVVVDPLDVLRSEADIYEARIVEGAHSLMASVPAEVAVGPAK
jgi:hypothetical protein